MSQPTGGSARGIGTALVPRAVVGGVVAVTVVLIAAAVAIGHDAAWLAWLLAALALPLAAIAVIDVRTRRIPNPLTVTVAGVAVLVVAAHAVTRSAFGSLARAVAAAVVVALVYLVAHRFFGVGFGDVKLAATLAFVTGWSGWEVVLAFVVVAQVVAVPAAVWVAVRRRGGQVPMAPSFVVGLYTAVALRPLL